MRQGRLKLFTNRLEDTEDAAHTYNITATMEHSVEIPYKTGTRTAIERYWRAKEPDVPQSVDGVGKSQTRLSD